MALKYYDILSIQDAQQYIDESPKSAAKMKKRLRDTMRKRMKVMEKHGLQRTEGYRMMELAMRESLGKLSAFNLSRMTSVLGSKKTSYTGFMEIQKKAMESINLEFGTWKENPKTGEQELEKPFIVSIAELDDFYDLMTWFKDNVANYVYSKAVKAQLENVWSTMKDRGQSWNDVKTFLESEKEKYYDSGEEPDIDSIISDYVKKG